MFGYVWIIFFRWIIFEVNVLIVVCVCVFVGGVIFRASCCYDVMSVLNFLYVYVSIVVFFVFSDLNIILWMLLGRMLLNVCLCVMLCVMGGCFGYSLCNKVIVFLMFLYCFVMLCMILVLSFVNVLINVVILMVVRVFELMLGRMLDLKVNVIVCVRRVLLRKNIECDYNICFRVLMCLLCLLSVFICLCVLCFVVVVEGLVLMMSECRLFDRDRRAKSVVAESM